MDAAGSDAVLTGEAAGLRVLLQTSAEPVRAHSFTWFDIGNPQALERARAAYARPDAPHILPKANEAIWFVGDTVIKFSDDTKFIGNRALRAREMSAFVPPLTGVKSHMYSYRLVPGQVLSSCVNLPLFERFLTHCETFWQPATLSANEQQRFRSVCRAFYKVKTLERVAQYQRTFGVPDGSESHQR